MHNNTSAFLNEIFPLLLNKAFIEDIFKIEDLKYYYRGIIEKSYSLFSKYKQNVLNDFYLSFFNEKDFIVSKNYKEHRKSYGVYKNKWYPLPYWGRSQWQLLNSIPHESLMQNDLLRKKYLMWTRRYEGWSCKNEKPNRHISIASISSGLTSPDKYQQFTEKQWYQSFLKYDNEDIHDRINRHFSVDEHANRFRDIIKSNPEKYVAFISKIISENRVNIRYQISGLEGLMQGAYDIYTIRKLYSLLMERTIPEFYNHSFIKLGRYFIDHYAVDNELIDYWIRLVELPFENKCDDYLLESREESNDKLFNQGWRTVNASAIELLAHLSFLETHTEGVYQYFLSIGNTLPIQLRLNVLYSLNKGWRFTNKQLLELFIIYTSEITSEIYWVAPKIINSLFNNYFEVLIPFIRQTMAMPKAAKSLGSYLLFGWFYGYEKSKELLLELHQIHPISIEESIGQASKYLKDSTYTEKCLFILEYYAKDKSAKIREAYSSGFYRFKSRDFRFVKNIIEQYILELNEDRLYNLYHYLKKCAKDNPIDCIDILHSIDFEKIKKREI